MTGTQTDLQKASSTFPVKHSLLAHRLKTAMNAAPLLVNGYAMVVSTGLTSLLGVVFWMAATHLYDQEKVGLGAALIASMTTISYFGQVNLANVLNRFLPRAGSRAAPLILKAYIAAGAVSGAIALGFALGIGTFAPALNILKTDPLAMSVFVLATIIWTIFALQDAALSGLRLSVLIPFENSIYSVLKIAFLIGFAFLATTPVNGIYLGWTLALVPVVLVVNIMIFRHLAVRRITGQAEPVNLRAVAGFLSWDYAGTIFLAAAFGLAPLMITSMVGVRANASYHIAWTFTYSVYLIGRSMSISLLAESAALPLRTGRLTADAFCHTMMMISGTVIVIWTAAPLLLELFGAVYVEESTSLLRVLILSCLPWAATTTFIAALRAQGQTLSVAAIQLATLILFAASSALLLPGYKSLGVAYGWLIAHSAVLAGFSAIYIARSRDGSLTDLFLLLLTSLSATAGGIKQRIFRSAKIPDKPGFDRHMIQNFDLNAHALRKAPVSASDSTTFLMGRKDAPSQEEKKRPVAAVKIAGTGPGIAALQRNARVLKDLHRNSRIKHLHQWLPEIIGTDQADGIYRTVETALPGNDGRSFIGDTADTHAAGDAVATFITRLHGHTSRVLALDQAWAEHWIDDPIENVIDIAGSHWRSGKHAAALECLRQDLRRALLGRELPLGRCHGDLSPGNVLLTHSDARSGGIELSGLIDWDNSQADAPLALDLYHFALTSRLHSSGEELGQIVRSCILENDFDMRTVAGFEPPASLIPPGGNEDKNLDRAMLLLVWLHHVKANLIKSRRYVKSWLWWRSNVDRVLDAISARTG